jgi:probable HAF family extracellular repeat protein
MPLCGKATSTVLALCSILALAIAAHSQDGSPTGKCGFQNLIIPAPNGTSTTPVALNDNGAIVGLLNSGSGVTFHTTGFLFSNGNFTHFRFPGSADTFANDMNKNGVIVGTFRGANGQGSFMVHNGVFHQVTLPGFPNAATSANGVNDLGDIVGVFTRNGSNVGFLLHQGKLTIISFPGATNGTFPSSINNQGVIVGSYSTLEQRDGTHGFMWKNGAFTNIEFPSAVATFPVKISNNGDVVGTYIDSAQFEHGFSFDKGRYSTLDRPGFADTRLTAVNSFDNILGFAFSESGGKWFKGFCSNVF